MKILIIYENVPENTNFYVLDVEPADWKWIQKTHRWYVNMSDVPPYAEKACNRLSEYLAGKPKTEITAGQPLSLAGIEFAVHTGFLL